MHPVHPRKVLIIRPDTLGDLVVFSPTLNALRDAWEGATLACVIRRPYVELARLLMPGVDWMPTEIDPFVRGPAECGAELERLRGEVARYDPDLLVAACPRRHWLDLALAAAAPRARHVAFASNEDDPYFGIHVRRSLGLKKTLSFREIATPASGEQDWACNFGLADHLLGREVRRSEPSLVPDADLLARADGVIQVHGLQPGRFVACAAAGFAHVRIKTWPADRFAATINWLHQFCGRRTLLIGHRGERAYLETVRAEAPGAAEVWTGGEGDLPILAAVLARSELYFGNDTGAMHVAAAVARPVVAIFGGGTWPRFQPACARAVCLVEPLPCFGCGWDCPFGDAPCVQAVGIADAQNALADVLNGPAGSGREVRRFHSVPYPVAAIMGKTAALARVRTADHLARENSLVETAFLAREKDGEIAMLKAAADEKDSEIRALKTATDGKDSEIKALKAATDAKDSEIRALKAATDEKDTEIKALKATTDDMGTALRGKEAEIAALATACEERLRLIVQLDAQIREKPHG